MLGCCPLRVRTLADESENTPFRVAQAEMFCPDLSGFDWLRNSIRAEGPTSWQALYIYTHPLVTALSDLKPMISRRFASQRL